MERSSAPLQYRIYNITGQQVACGNFQEHQTISLTGFAPGFYTLQLYNAHTIQSKGFIVA